MPFTIAVRKFIGARDDWTCQGLSGGCLTANHFHIEGGVNFFDGYMVCAAHWPDKHKRGWDRHPENGRILCQICHAVEEHIRGNDWGAERLLQMGVYTIHYVKEFDHQWHPELYQIEKLAMTLLASV